MLTNTVFFVARLEGRRYVEPYRPCVEILEIGKNLHSDSRFGFGFIIVKDSNSRLEIRLTIFFFLDSDYRFGWKILADKIRIRDSNRISNLVESQIRVSCESFHYGSKKYMSS